MLPPRPARYERALDRIQRYQDSRKSMGAVLDASGRRDIGMESQVEELRQTLSRRVESLSSAKPSH